MEAGCDSGSSVASSEQERNVAALSNTCVMLQSQVRSQGQYQYVLI